MASLPDRPHEGRERPGGLARPVSAAVAVIVTLLAVLRLFLVVLHAPTLGYANNFDMVRTQACLQVWPADAARPPGYATPEAPLERYRVAEVEGLRGLCVPGPDVLFAWAGRVAGVSLFGPNFPIRVVGAVRAAAFAALAFGFLAWVLRRGSPVEALTHATVCLVVVSDPANTLYANGFYRESSTLLFAWASVLLFWAVCRFGPTRSSSAALAVSLLLLGLSGRQHLLLPAVVVVGLLASARGRRDPVLRTALLAALASLLAVGGTAFLYRSGGPAGPYLASVDLANATDTFLGAVLPAADDPVAAARTLGLPSPCAEHRGETWYTPGVQERHPCPEVAGVSRLRLALLAAEQPRFLARLTREGLDRAWPWKLRYLGSVAGEERGDAGKHVFSVSDLLERLPRSALDLLFLLSLPAGLLAAAASRRIGSPGRRSTALVALVLGASAWVVFYSALFGDGTFEFQKHVHLLTSYLLALLVVAAFAAGAALLRPGAGSVAGQGAGATPQRSARSRTLRRWRTGTP